VQIYSADEVEFDEEQPDSILYSQRLCELFTTKSWNCLISLKLHLSGSCIRAAQIIAVLTAIATPRTLGAVSLLQKLEVRYYSSIFTNMSQQTTTSSTNLSSNNDS
jgi:hypothetical protein